MVDVNDSSNISFRRSFEFLTLETELLTLFVEECEFVWKFKYAELQSLFARNSWLSNEHCSELHWQLDFEGDISTLLVNESYRFSADIFLRLLKNMRYEIPVLSEIHFYFSICGKILKQSDILVSGEVLNDRVRLANALDISVLGSDSLKIYVKILTKFRSTSPPLNQSFCQDNFDVPGEPIGDIIICADGGLMEIEAHRSILSKCSEVFQAMLCINMKESNTGKIIIEDFNGSTIKKMVHFIYTHKIEFNEVNEAVNLFRAADKYDLRHLRFYCVNYLTIALNETNAISILKLADTYNESDLKKRALNYIVENENHFRELLTLENVGEKNSDLLKEIISFFSGHYYSSSCAVI